MSEPLTIALPSIGSHVVPGALIVGWLGQRILDLVGRNEGLADLRRRDLEARSRTSSAGEDTEAWISPGRDIDALVSVLLADLVELGGHLCRAQELDSKLLELCRKFPSGVCFVGQPRRREVVVIIFAVTWEDC